MPKNSFKKIISNTKDSYDKIANLFSQTRQYNWEDIKLYVSKYVKNNQNILDLGCGNGRLYQILSKYNIDYTGIDISANLIFEASKKYPQVNFLINDMSKIKLGSNQYDIIFVIASFHHLPSANLRKKVLSNIHKSIKPGGLLIMTNWNLYQAKYKQYFNINKKLDPNLEEKDTLIPWKDSRGKILTNRFYHAFTLDEIEKMLVNFNFKIIENKISRFNLITIAKKQ